MVNRAICTAIGARAVLEFSYEGSQRTVEPHCHGISTADNEVLRAFQTAGFSRSGRPVEWKLFDVRKISRLAQTGATFETNRPGYRVDDIHMRQVHCHV